jgi:formylglycine-generating enzyme required for sulfatase activity
MGRYPVTNSQYQAFIDDRGYGDRKWWSDAGWEWLKKAGVTEPRWWRDRRCNGLNQPVIGVSFFEAEACGAWAGGRLPLEQEWEAAARGPEGSVYPWGDDWEDGICNTLEVGLGMTSPVGLFPRSRQAQLGIEDLAGNVIEWCATTYNDPDNTAPAKDRNAERVLRGGVWFGAGVIAECALRGIYSDPANRSELGGFRCVCSSRIAG